tara:strand:- start:433 stop:1161 length:729 start_codon:yes stop_codon:yes gene_type:complete
MRVYRVNGIEHKVFDPDDILPAGLIVQSNWRKGRVGEWIKADDDCVLEVLRQGTMKRQKGKKREVAYVGTCTGTFPAYNHAKMDTSKRINIYSFGGGKLADDVLIERVNLSKCEQVFVVYLASGLTPQEAYMKAYPTNDPGYAKFKSTQLVKTTRIRTAMKEELKPVLEELKLDETFVLKNIKEVILSSEKDDTRLKALFKLADIMDMEDKTRTQQTTLAVGAFKGFSDDMIQVAERPKEIE